MSESDESSAFNYLQDLPSPGITLLEASAGTGKTYTIAGLVVRYLAAGVSAEDLLVVTFTKAATGELRSRVRLRLIDAQTGLHAHLAGESVSGADQDLVEVLADCSREEAALRLSRLRLALSNFDAATITTTHGFCEAALSELGLAGDSELRPEFVPDVREMAHQAAVDVYMNRYAQAEELPFRVVDAVALVHAAYQAWDAEVEPADAPNAVDKERVDYVRQVRAEISRRKRIAGLMTFDDQVGRLRNAVMDDARGTQAAAALADRYKVILVDEFQDTDTSQWEALRTAFGGSSSTLILIGDPKQAIYSFRGADVFAYLDASASASSQATLRTNFRSSPGVLNSLDALFGDLELGDPKIRYARSRPAGVQTNAALQSLRVRTIVDESPIEKSKSGNIVKAVSLPFIAGDVAADIVARLTRDDGDASKVEPGDIAVLTNSHVEAERVAMALRERAVPAVIRGNRSVLATPSAIAIRRLLEALDQPSAERAARRLAATDLIGFKAAEFAAEDDQDSPLGLLHRNIQDWAQLLDEVGIEAVFSRVKADYQLLDRLLGQVGGERILTDFEQVVELVGGYAATQNVPAGGLLAWLIRRIEESGTDIDERVRRLDTDAAAVQVITIHAAKGLEYAVVYCPFLWSPSYMAKTDDPLLFHADGKRRLYVGTTQSDARRAATSAHNLESAGEALRKAYVALTRAKRELVVHWVPGYDWPKSPLACILAQHGKQPLLAMKALSEGCPDIAIEPMLSAPSPDSWLPRRQDQHESIALSLFDRDLDLTWRRTSFSSMTAVAHDAPSPAADVPGDSVKRDEADVEESIADDPRAAEFERMVSPLSDLRGGTSMGSFVHLVFEDIDFAAPDLRAQLLACLDRYAQSVRLTQDESEMLVDGLEAAIDTPLGSDVADVRLRDIPRTDRIDEMGFEFALAGGQSPIGHVSTGAIADVLDATLASDDALRGYLPSLRDPTLASDVHGYLSGSIDLVLRTKSDGRERFSVVDYKTNRLAPGELTAWDYRPSAVRDAVFASHYPLQFLLYSVALHRYLRARLPGYELERNLGPVKYLFIRGMLGPATPSIDREVCGVFTWQPTVAVVEGLSDLLANGVASGVAKGVTSV